MNIRLDIEYDGTEFFGWQVQQNLPTIQGHLEAALQQVVKSRVILVGAGRTDSGVHALGQVANFNLDSPGRIEPWRWKLVLNSMLPPTIRIVDSRAVPNDFHAQKNALSKIYEYRVLNQPCASALDRRVYFCPRPMDWDAIRRALPHFIGTKDFRSFKGAKADVVTTVRTVTRFELIEDMSRRGLYVFQVEGSGFLKQMVRTMVGTVMDVGKGLRKPEDMVDIIRARNRMAAGRTMPASGLCLVSIKYQ
jgi:tRNA pseudouridine38-40 synthase